MQLTQEKKHAHELIDRLDPSLLVTAVRFLEFIVMDPIIRSLATAPVDDEPLSEEEKETVRRSEAWFQQHGGKGIPMEEVLREFGLSLKDFPLEKHGG